jgi:hypothetical protein
LFLALPSLAVCQTAILQLRVVEGEGAVHAAGTRSTRPLTVEVTDETGKPVERAAVSFHLPEEGPGGLFLNGLRTDVVVTDAAGRAGVRGLIWNRIPGRFQIRIVASFEQARAGIESSQYVEGPPVAAASAAVSSQAGHSHTKWFILGALAAGGAAAGLLAGHGGANTTPAAAPAPALTIGAPSITVGKP